MLIGIDGRALAGPMAGSGRYVRELCRVLDRSLPQARFAVFSNRPVTLPVDSVRWTRRGDESAWGSRLPPFLWYALRAGRLAARDGVTAFWGATNFLPCNLPPRIRTVLTVLDLVHRVMPESMSLKHRLAFGLCFRAGIRRADVLVSISEGTSERLRLFGYRRADMVVRPGVDEHFGPVSASRIAAMRNAFGLDGPFLLSVSTLEPRKNLRALIDAFTIMRQAGELPRMPLVLAGQPGWKTGRLDEAIGRAREAGADIRPLGHVPDDLLPALYAGAEAVVMPSIYEGFGLPILEARMCGARVVASDMPETREAGGREVTYIAPTVAGIRSGIHDALARPRRSVTAGEEVIPRWDVEGSRLAAALIGQPGTRSP